MTKTQSAGSRRLVTACALGLFAMATAAAGATDTVQPTASADAAQSSDATPGMRVYIDAKTGKLRQPTAEERADEGRAHAAAAKLRDSKAKTLKQKTFPNGMVRLDTQGIFEEEATATLNADGSLSYAFGEEGTQATATKLEDK